MSPGLKPRQRHVVLIAPEIHWNTGNIGRTCLGAGARLHLVKPLGFSLSEKAVRRAGLDYWPKVDLRLWESFGDLLDTLKPAEDELALFTKNGRSSHYELPAAERLFLIFGSETRGLPQPLLSRFAKRTYRIPIRPDIRCLNLSTAVGIALFDSLRPTPTESCPTTRNNITK
jgi:tRNA (cytidine/uridine-2'-O-)-methyltransferase